jgi:deoxyribodipyrimidine photo-lyase
MQNRAESVPETVPSPREVATADPSVASPPETVTGTVVWHREHLRIADQPAVAAAAARSDRILPLFVFDPAFYTDRGLACDSRIDFLHDCLSDLDRQYRECGPEDTGGLTLAHGDPVEILERFAEAGWDVFAARSPTGRYGLDRDERARDRCRVRFVSGDGLVRGTDRPRENWQEQVESWLAEEQYTWDPETVAIDTLDTGVTIDGIDDHYGLDPQKTMVPDGGTDEAREQLVEFVDRIADYPGNISSPVDARGGTSGLSPYLRFGCLSVRQVFQYVSETVPDSRGTQMFVSRLFWNLHYRQKLEDWPGWLDTACNPELQGFNADRHDPELVQAWKDGRTGYPMVDASLRCLRETGWLNFRMRALGVSFYYHILQQPWLIGADHYHEHLIDSVAAINYTQWQYQCGLVGKPTLRLYNPIKQVEDQDPEGEFVRRWVPELEDLPAEHLPRPEKTPLAVQEDCGVRIGEEYPYPIVEYEAAKERFWNRYETVKPKAAARLAEEEVARRASLSGGFDAARSIAEEYGDTSADDDGAGQTSLGAFD